MNIRTSVLKDDGLLPLVVEPANGAQPTTDDLIELIGNRREWLETSLLHHGGVLFRGFAVRQIEEFQRVSRTLIPELKPYVEGQSPRTKVIDNVYTSTEFPPQYSITHHNELSYAKTPPRRIIFHCHLPAVKGGETPIADCRRVYRDMPDDLRERFDGRGVKYTKTMHGNPRGLGKSWMDHFETSDRSVVEGYLRENDVEFDWLPDGSLRTAAHRPGAINHPETGERIWFNQANLWHLSNVDERHRQQILQRCGEANLPTHAYFGDGSPIADEQLDRVRQVFWDTSVIFPWQQGDVLYLDNYLVAHGRMPYEGSRKILVAMG